MRKGRQRKPTKAEQRAAIKRFRGLLRPLPGEPSFTEQMALWKAEDRAAEKRRDDFLMSIGADKPRDVKRGINRLKGKASALDG